MNLRAKAHPLGIAVADRLVLCTAEGDVLAIDTTDGSKVWDHLRQSDEVLRPAHQDGVVYLGGKTLTALNIGDGKELWSVPAGKDSVGDPQPCRSPTAYPGMLFAAHNHRPKRLDPKTGKYLWRMASGNGPMRLQGSGVWVADSDEHFPRVSGLDLMTGRPRMVYDKGEGTRWGLAASGNRVFFHDSHSLTPLPVF